MQYVSTFRYYFFSDVLVNFVAFFYESPGKNNLLQGSLCTFRKKLNLPFLIYNIDKCY